MTQAARCQRVEPAAALTVGRLRCRRRPELLCVGLEVTEFELIARYFSPRTTHTILAGGDDAALVAVTPGMELVVSTDMLVGGRHFFDDADAYGVGWKSLAVNLSDMAAMGARARWVTLSLALPQADEGWISAFMRGFLDLANALRRRSDRRRYDPRAAQHLRADPGRSARRTRAAAARARVPATRCGSPGPWAMRRSRSRICAVSFELQPQELDYVRARLDRPTPRVGLGQRPARAGQQRDRRLRRPAGRRRSPRRAFRRAARHRVAGGSPVAGGAALPRSSACCSAARSPEATTTSCASPQPPPATRTIVELAGRLGLALTRDRPGGVGVGCDGRRRGGAGAHARGARV